MAMGKVLGFGILGIGLLWAFLSKDAKADEPDPLPVPPVPTPPVGGDPTPPPPVGTCTECVQQGLGVTVAAVQRKLIGAKLSVGSTGADGKCGNNTKAAISQYQYAKNLPQTGCVDGSTWAYLASEPDASGPPSAVDVAEYPDTNGMSWVLSTPTFGQVQGTYNDEPSEFYPNPGPFVRNSTEAVIAAIEQWAAQARAMGFQP